MTMHSKLFHCVAAIAFAVGLSCQASAEVNQVTIGRAVSVAYLPVMVMESRKLLEKHARAAGLGDVKVSYAVMTGGTQLNDALISGSLQIATGGVAPFLVIWAKTHGNIEVKGLSPFNSTPLYLNSRNPTVKSIKDFTENDRIAIVAPKSAIQAILLQIEASKVFGPENYAKLDHLTVAMPLADAAAQLIAGGGQITADFTVPPFSYQELADPHVHTVLTSTQILGGPATYGVAYASADFVKANPKLSNAFLAALREAIGFIHSDRHGAREIFLATFKTKPRVDVIDKMMGDPEITFGQTPQNMTKFVEFMNRIGILKVKPDSWKDLFFPEVHDRAGS